MYEYNCKIVRVIDGDSILIDIDLGFSHWIHNESIRLYGVDTPECRTRDAKEKGKFGRYLGTIYLTEETSINAALVKERLAVPYFGQSKVRVKEAHLANRLFLKEKGWL